MSTAANCSTRGNVNAGTPPLLALLSPRVRRILHVGCRAGDNARVLGGLRPEIDVRGITLSPSEARATRAHMSACWIADLEHDRLEFVAGRRFDGLLLSHVLEHLADPARAIARLVGHLEPGGQVPIAVPNVLHWSVRARALAGRFEYQDSGILDRTHLLFFTATSASRELVEAVPGLEVVRQSASGSVPLWLLRRHIRPKACKAWSQTVDAWGVRHWPGLFGWQILLDARER